MHVQMYICTERQGRQKDTHTITCTDKPSGYHRPLGLSPCTMQDILCMYYLYKVSYQNITYYNNYKCKYGIEPLEITQCACVLCMVHYLIAPAGSQLHHATILHNQVVSYHPVGMHSKNSRCRL